MNSSGARAEEACAQFLRARGLVVLARNWRCRHGEIDIVAEDRGVVVFAEVRMRSGARFGGAAESITAAKRARLVAAARLYLCRRPQASCRFDVLLVGPGPCVNEWIRDAFSE
ncbi:MAG TPA: YraN family protein [Burkholderiales bacterium]|nr:YraN family protein [Burkholderiales bacterium]